MLWEACLYTVEDFEKDVGTQKDKILRILESDKCLALVAGDLDIARSAAVEKPLWNFEMWMS